MTISEMPRNKANNPTQTSSSAPCTDRYCWAAQKPSTKDGIITLTGHVRTWAEHDAVIDAAQMAIGVIDVRDNLQITG
jgi:hypothetical protein